jgi:LAGLIDADG DNA endonuclease family protein
MNKNKSLLYQVRNLNEITKEIIPYFENYPLITQKQSDFLLFKEIIKLMNKNEHLTEDGLVKIINLKASLNKGLSNKLKIFFSNVITITRPKLNLPITINYNWIAGFFSGEYCFSIGIYKSNTNKIGYGITLHISITQNYKDKLLIDKLMNTLNCGIVSKNYKNNMAVLNIYKFKDIYNIIIPLI